VYEVSAKLYHRKFFSHLLPEGIIKFQEKAYYLNLSFHLNPFLGLPGLGGLGGYTQNQEALGIIPLGEKFLPTFYFPSPVPSIILNSFNSLVII